jgi:(E)-4-hydroxy-3-methyl-but-2-enyl pyrophosphate reductase
VKVLVAKTAGFCMGVQRALDLVLDEETRCAGGALQVSPTAAPPKLFTLGPLIHNNQALEALQERGIETAHDLDDVTGSSVVIRAHGAGPTIRERIRERNLTVIDATCPRVVRCQRAVQRAAEAGRQVLIAGDTDHAEVTALVDFSGGRAMVLSSVEDASAAELHPPVTLVAQTTFNSKTYSAIAAALSKRLADRPPTDLEIVQSLCRSTEDRQLETIDLARAVDAVVVVGGKHSANTKRLAEVARDLGRSAFHVETADELDPGAFGAFSSVGVTAGASTPAWVTERVVERLKEFGSPARKALRRFCVALLGSNALLAAGAASLTAAVSLIAARPVSPSMLFIAFAYAFFAYSANREGNVTRPGAALSVRAGFFLRYRGPIVVSGVLLSAAALALAFQISLATGIALSVATLLAGLYSLRILPTGFSTPRLGRLRDIPGSKDAMIALAWLFVAVVLPLLPGASGDRTTTVLGLLSTGPMLLVAVAVLALSLSASTALTVGDVQSDRLIGRETMAMLIGRRPAWALSAILAAVVASVSAVAVAVRWLDPAGAGLAFSGLMVMIAALGRRRPGDALRHGLAVQMSLLATGPVAWLAAWLVS